MIYLLSSGALPCPEKRGAVSKKEPRDGKIKKVKKVLENVEYIRYNKKAVT